jgi:hypothetical protein
LVVGRFSYNPTVIGNFGRVVGSSNFIVEELTTHVADEAHELTRLLQQITARVHLDNPRCQVSQQRFEVSRPVLAVRLVGHTANFSSRGVVEQLGGEN